MNLKDFREVTEKINEETIICFNNTGLFDDESTNIVEGAFMRYDVNIPYVDQAGELKVSDVIIFD